MKCRTTTAVKPDGQVEIEREGEQGASMLEYALLAALIAVVCILAITFLGRQACVSFSRVGSSMSGSNG
jgi:pilus assembly protein Flp/PilA